MSERSERISKLLEDPAFHVAYLLSKLTVNIASQTRALRRRRKMTQKDLESATGMRQSRISAIETPGATNPSIDTLARLAAAYKVGMIVKYAPMSEVVRWENRFNQDNFDVVELEEDEEFLNPSHQEVETGSTGPYLVVNHVHSEENQNVSMGGLINGKGQQGSYNLRTKTNWAAQQAVGV